MGKRREIRVKAVGKPTRGMFKGELMPNEWLSPVDVPSFQLLRVKSDEYSKPAPEINA